MYKDMTAPDANLLTVKEVMQKLRVSRITLLRWDKAGTLRAVRLKPGSPRKYRSEDIERIINEQ